VLHHFSGRTPWCSDVPCISGTESRTFLGRMDTHNHRCRAEHHTMATALPHPCCGVFACVFHCRLLLDVLPKSVWWRRVRLHSSFVHDGYGIPAAGMLGRTHERSIPQP
jgi:hypothetical protein